MTLSVDIRHRLGDFSLDAAFSSDGGVTALFGRSGSGKTSIIRIIAGLIQPDHGRVSLDGTVLADTDAQVFVPRHRRRFGYVFQEARLFPHLSVRQNLNYGRWFALKSEHGESFDGVVDLLGIAALLDRRPAKLSGGEKQRVAIGRALLSSPRLLLMDEPLAALDEARKAEILPYLERLRDETKVPIIYVPPSPSPKWRGWPAVSSSCATVRSRQWGRRSRSSASFSGPQAILTVAKPVFCSKGRVEHIDFGHRLTIGGIEGGNSYSYPGSGWSPARAVRVHIPARDVMLATGQRQKASALLNILGRGACHRHGGRRHRRSKGGLRW